jgi:hypothetical protein
VGIGFNSIELKVLQGWAGGAVAVPMNIVSLVFFPYCELSAVSLHYGSDIIRRATDEQTVETTVGFALFFLENGLLLSALLVSRAVPALRWNLVQRRREKCLK